MKQVATARLVYTLSDSCEDRNILGNKGANLVTMTRLGLPIPPGFVISIDAFHRLAGEAGLPSDEIDSAIAQLERAAGKKLGSGLAVSVRSSGPVSMPGMMDTLLNIGSREALMKAVDEVFASWDSPRAKEYRRLNDIPGDLGTAVVVQVMVMGTGGETSGTGVLFTRNPNDGENELFGEYMQDAQGEDLVSGAHTPGPLSLLEQQQPDVYAELERHVKRLESYYRDMQDVEFTVEDGTLYILQTRSGKWTARAAVKSAVDMAVDGLITKSEAVMRVTPENVELMLHRTLDRPERWEPFLKGLAAAPGAVTGRAVFRPERVAEESEQGPTILVRPETTPDDIQGIAAADGVLTASGGLSSHAAIVTRAMGKPCVCGAEDARVDDVGETLTVAGATIAAGDVITIDGSTGNVYLGELPTIESEAIPELETLLSWADDARRLGVWANADTPEMVSKALQFGAEGIGLLRTERQFGTPDSLAAIRKFILSGSEEERAEALEALHDLQAQDFQAIFRALNGAPVIIRLLDMPLHEFLPPAPADADSPEARRAEELAEVNPMMGHRGVRLGISFPELYEMQVTAIKDAMTVVPAKVAVMIPQVITSKEIAEIKSHIDHAGLRVGIMMETARACMRAGRLAEIADFFSFGTNDLTQAVFSFSREDVEKKFLANYLEKGVLPDNPFEVLDAKGVGRLMETAIYWARRTASGLEIGVCGEHAGEPRSIACFHRMGVTYVSCSPYRVPVARLAAGRAALETTEAYWAA